MPDSELNTPRLSNKCRNHLIRLLLAGWAALLLSLSVSAQDLIEQGLTGFGGNAIELLDPDVAFAPAVIDVTNNTIVVQFSIAEGYYLYRKSLAATPLADAVEVTSFEVPDGIIVNDEYFGESEVYRESLALTLNYQNPGNTDSIDISIGSQGCADVGVCYPPQEQTLKVAIPQQAETPVAALFQDQGQNDAAFANSSSSAQNSPAAEGALSDGLASLLSSDDQELLPPDVAFVPSVSIVGDDRIDIRFSIEPGYYLYRDKFAVRFAAGSTASIARVDISQGKLQEDAFFGNVEVHRDAATLSVILNTATAGQHSLLLDYQGCADIGVCFPPQTTTLPVSLATQANSEAATTAAVITGQGNITAGLIAVSSDTGMSASVELNEYEGLAATLSKSGVWLIIATFFGLGLLLSFTPCVFPMIPILSGLIVGQGEGMTTRRAFTLSVVYVLAMASTYTIAGVLVGLSGENFQIWFQNPWVLSAFALLFVLLSLSMFGFYELQMPAAIQNRLNNISSRSQAGTYIGAAIMGLLSALIVGPCITAPLVGALIFIADTGDAVIGGTALFALGMGMGAPLILIGASAGRLLPRAGAWMENTKAVFGVMMIAMAIWMLSRFLDASAILVLTAALIIVSGIYLGALEAVPAKSSGWHKLSKGFGLIALVYGTILLLGAASGGRDLLQPLKGFNVAQQSGEAVFSDKLDFQRVRTLGELELIVASAKQNNQDVMLDFYADWCITCIEMEKLTFSDPGVQKRLKNVVLLKADVTENNADDKALLKHFRMFGPPAIIFYTPAAGEIRSARLVGFVAADDFSRHLDKYLSL